jgi:hypothetical protein
MKTPILCTTVLLTALTTPGLAQSPQTGWELIVLDAAPACIQNPSGVRPAAGRALSNTGEVLARGERGRSAQAVGYVRGIDGVERSFDPLGSCESNPVFLNDHGQVAGLVDNNLNTGGQTRAIWRASPRTGVEVLTGIPTANLPDFTLQAFNDRGDVAGSTLNLGTSLSTTPWLWRDGIGWTDLTSLSPLFTNAFVFVRGLNANRDMLFALARPGGVQLCFYAPAAGTAFEVSFSSSSTVVVPGQLAEDGSFCGIYRLPDGTADHAFLFTPQNGVLDIHNNPLPESAGLFVAGDGALSGVLGVLSSSRMSAPENVFVWNPQTGMRSLFTRAQLQSLLPAGATFASCYTEAANGRLEFLLSVGDGNDLVFALSDPAGSLLPLQPLVDSLTTESFTITAADAINDQRDILLTAIASNRPGAPTVTLLLRHQRAGTAQYGVGEPGTAGAPALSATPPTLGAVTTLSLRSSTPGAAAPAALLAGFRPDLLPTPVGGSVLLEIAASLGITIPAGGPQGLGLTIPNLPALIGESVFFQLVHLDGGAAQAVAFSRGLELRLGR